MKENPETCTLNIVESDSRKIKKRMGSKIQNIFRSNEIGHAEIKVEDADAKAAEKFANDMHGDVMLNQANLSLYNVNKLGGLKRLDERDISLGICRNFIKS